MIPTATTMSKAFTPRETALSLPHIREKVQRKEKVWRSAERSERNQLSEDTASLEMTHQTKCIDTKIIKHNATATRKEIPDKNIPPQKTICTNSMSVEYGQVDNGQVVERAES